MMAKIALLAARPSRGFFERLFNAFASFLDRTAAIAIHNGDLPHFGL